MPKGYWTTYSYMGYINGSYEEYLDILEENDD